MTDVPVIVSDTDDGRDVPDSDVVGLTAPGSDVIYPVTVARYWTLMQQGISMGGGGLDVARVDTRIKPFARSANPDVI